MVEGSYPTLTRTLLKGRELDFLISPLVKVRELNFLVSPLGKGSHWVAEVPSVVASGVGLRGVKPGSRKKIRFVYTP